MQNDKCKIQNEDSQPNNRTEIDIVDRTYRFAMRIVRMRVAVPNDTASHVLWRQLGRSGTSVGSNVEEAQSAQTKKEFVRKMNIALSESREAHYWLRLFRDADLIDASKIAPLVAEADEIKRILGAIVSSARKRTETE
jgi:four helix bundle protein